MKRILSILIVMVMVMSLCVISVGAATPSAGMVGDLDKDFDVNILDATYIQMVLAKLHEIDTETEYLADVDQDGTLSIVDATYIQRFLADLVQDNYIGRRFNYDMQINDHYSDYESGMAIKGVPVTFGINAYTGSPVLSYELYVNDVCVATSDTNSITYTFEEAGDYIVDIRVNALFGIGNYRDLEFTVVEPYESDIPMFKTLYLTGKIQWGTITYGVDGMAVYADAIGGQAPYQYKFVFERPVDVSNETETVVKTQDYSEDNVYELEVLNYEDVTDGYFRWQDLDCKLTVYIKDANDNVVSREMPIHYCADVPVG